MLQFTQNYVTPQKVKKSLFSSLVSLQSRKSFRDNGQFIFVYIQHNYKFSLWKLEVTKRIIFPEFHQDNLKTHFFIMETPSNLSSDLIVEDLDMKAKSIDAGNIPYSSQQWIPYNKYWFILSFLLYHQSIVKKLYFYIM